MEARIRSFYLSPFLFLIALTCLSQGHSQNEEPFVWKAIQNLPTNIHDRIAGSFETAFNTFFSRQQVATTQRPNPDFEPNYRQIIVAPVRCEPGYVLVRNVCRKPVG